MPETAVPTDEDLVRLARQGDAQAFRGLVERYEGIVASTVIGMLGRGAEADDVGQETFIRFYRSLDKFRGDSSLKTYLTRIAINQSLKALKKRQRWKLRFFDSGEESTSELMLAVPAKDELGEQEMKEVVQQALQTLTPPYRSVVVLRILEGYDVKETAAMLGIAQGTVMSRLSRALEKLGDVLKPLLDGRMGNQTGMMR